MTQRAVQQRLQSIGVKGSWFEPEQLGEKSKAIVELVALPTFSRPSVLQGPGTLLVSHVPNRRLADYTGDLKGTHPEVGVKSCLFIGQEVARLNIQGGS